MYSIRLSKKILRLPIFWRIVGLVSSIVGFSCYGLSSTFTDLFGEWNPLKIVIYSLVSSLFSGMMLFAKNFGFSKSFMLKAHIGYFILVLTSLYSFFQDRKSSDGNDEINHHRNRILSLISSCAFALMSVSVSRLFDLGFETELFNFFLGCIMVSFMKLNLKFAVVGAICCYFLIHIRYYSVSQQEIRDAPQEEIRDTPQEEHVVIDVPGVVEIKPESGEVPTEASASTDSAIAHVTESDITESHLPILREEEEDRISLDKKVDDFISRFNKELKLQKLDSDTKKSKKGI
ncbi:Exocyst subunit Exo70 family protein [Quillaja saponaria]|uniref:Exocyst subunit Exo70 family protein n=1 Tax=Quillaja saponaria TaxID=32244 RepID=A0AAD7LHM1_QUISA|nr:Exocyst subunit Exo70 family protein [Quillaja saponaria]